MQAAIAASKSKGDEATAAVVSVKRKDEEIFSLCEKLQAAIATSKSRGDEATAAGSSKCGRPAVAGEQVRSPVSCYGQNRHPPLLVVPRCPVVAGCPVVREAS